MPNYVEYIKVGSGESWPVRDAEAHSRLDILAESSLTDGALLSNPEVYDDPLESQDESAFETWLDARLSEMDDGTAMTIKFSLNYTATTGISNGLSFGHLFKLNSDYAELSGMNHFSEFLYKHKEAGVWKPTCSLLEALNKNSKMILTSEQYGAALPDPGNPGRIFFKKV